MNETTRRTAAAASGLVLFTLASGQFLMTLDSSVMNVSIATVAHDVGTTVTGIQTAITLYTLVMASLMITGGKLGQILGRKRAFSIGCVIYGCGSFITALSKSLPVLIFGWSFLEGVGAALILPAIVALVASNFPQDQRPRAYGLVASAGAIAVAAGPLIGGLFTTYLSWRWVFVGEVLLVLAILLLTRRMADTPGRNRDPSGPHRHGAVRLRPGSGRLRDSPLGQLGRCPAESGCTDVDRPVSGAVVDPRRRGRTPSIHVVGDPSAGPRQGGAHRSRHAQEPGATQRAHRLLLPVSAPSRTLLRGALISVGCPWTLGDCHRGPTSPLSATLLLAAVGIPKLFPHASPRRVVQLGFLALLAGIVIMMALLEAGAGPDIVTWPMLLAGLGIGHWLPNSGA